MQDLPYNLLEQQNADLRKEILRLETENTQLRQRISELEN
jgi:cell division protein FtsB